VGRDVVAYGGGHGPALGEAHAAQGLYGKLMLPESSPAAVLYRFVLAISVLPMA
jgi:hypothetical protein